MLKQREAKFVLGVTGNIGCGKTTVARMFKTKNSLLIDADSYGRSLLTCNKKIYKKIKKVFGREIIKGDNSIDRQKLARIVFSDKSELIKLNRIVHPPLVRAIRRFINNSDKKIIILDAALIIEAGLGKIVDKLVVVKAKRQQQILRKTKNRRLRKEDVIMRMKFQIPQNKKLGFADFIIDNSGHVGKTRKQVSEIRRKLWKS
jgi:dephospho-CoA kinase